MPGMLLRANLNNVRLLSYDNSTEGIWTEKGDFFFVTHVHQHEPVSISTLQTIITLLHLRTQQLCKLMFVKSTDPSHDFIYFDFQDFDL